MRRLEEVAPCKRPKCPLVARPGRLYCSNNCAQLDEEFGAGDSSNTQSSLTGLSGIQGPGELSAQSTTKKSTTETEGLEIQSTDGRLTAPTTRKTKSEPTHGNVQNMQTSVTPTDKRKTDIELSGVERTVTMSENDGTPGTKEISWATVKKRQSEERNETQRMDSSDLRTRLDGARSDTMSLIDESASVLLDVMKSAAKPETSNDGLIVERKSFQQINSVANLGKQIASLAKVKLDAIKAALN